MAEAAGFQKYDPSNPAPYQAEQMPDPTPAAPSPLPTQGPEINGAVKHSGAVATVADGILRGFMQGRAYSEAKKVMQLKSKSDGLQASYNQDAQRLYQMASAGVDKNSQEYKTAQSAVQGSWGALMDFYGQHIGEQDSGKKKSKAKQIEGGILGALQSKDPMEQSRAWYQVAQKAGPPVMSQIAILNTPQAQAQRKVEAQATSNAATATGIDATQLQHQQTVAQAQATIDNLNRTPRDQWTPAMQQQYDSAAQVLTPVQTPKIVDEGLRAADEVFERLRDPKYQVTDRDRDILRAAGYPIEAKSKVTVTKTGEIIKENEDGTYEILRNTQRDYLPHGRGSGSGNPADKSYQKWDAYYRQHYPQLGDDERKALVERKVEGASQHSEGEIQYDAITEPRKFDNSVLTAAVGRLQGLPEYKNLQSFDDAIANLVGQDETGYAYNPRVAAPRKDGQYSGNVSKDQLTKMDRDLQEQIRAVLNDPKNGLSQNEKRAAMARMRPLFGPASRPTGSGNPPVPPPAQAAPPAAQASSPAPHGGNEHDPMGILN